MPKLSYRFPPGPRPLIKSENIRAFQRDQLGFFQRLSAEYGPVSSFRLATKRFVLLNEPELVRQLLTKDYAKFRKGRFFEIAKPFLGEGLLRSEGAFHARQRKLIQPLFYRARIQEYGQTMIRCGSQWSEQLTPGTYDLANEMQRLTLKIAGLTLLDTDLEAEASEIGDALKVMLSLFTHVNSPLKKAWSKLPTAKRAEIQGAVSSLDRSILTIINRQRNQGASQPNLIAHLMTLQDEMGGLSDAQIRDEAMSLFLAGHETTANALAWTWYLLSQHPRIEACFHQELERVLAGRLPTPEDLNALTYTRQILTESMRIYPPAWILGRRLLEDYRLADYHLPKGTIFILSPYLMHHERRFYSDPEQFRPERWNTEFKNALPKFAYYPFGGGPRNCIGEAFAWMEGVLLLATIGQRWRFEALTKQVPQLEPLVTLRPKAGLRLKAVLR